LRQTHSTMLAAKNLILISNPHSIYELLKTVVNKPKKCLALFQFIQALKPLYIRNTSGLLLAEIYSLTENTPTDYFLGSEYKIKLDTAVKIYASGKVWPRKVVEINDFEKEFEEDNIFDTQKKILKKYLKKNSFEKIVMSYLNMDNISEIIKNLKLRTNQSITEAECKIFLNNIDSYRALANSIKSDLYLNYCAARGGRPQNSLNDLRHVIDSSYCHLFITNDKKLTKLILNSFSRMRVCA
jgi:hypothetical protein